MSLITISTNELKTVTPLREEELIDSFLSSQDIKAVSKMLYKRTLKQFFNWLNLKGYLLSDIARPEILRYKEELLLRGVSSLTVASYITSLRLFYEWSEAMKLYPNVCKGIKSPKRKKEFKKRPLLPAQATTLLDYYEHRSLRDFALINLLLRTGLRTIEVERAKVEDITFIGSQRVLLIKGKGAEERDNFVVLTPKAYAPLEAYLKAREPLSPAEPLFTSTSNNSKGEAITTRSIRAIAKEGLKAIGLNEKSFTTHSLRHTGATNILRATGDLEQTRLFCRHTNPATTLIYVGTIEEERRIKNSGEAVLDTLF